MMSRFKLDEHKMCYHLDRVAEWQYGDPSGVFPIYVEISPVGYCNHRCTFCALDYLGYKKTKLDTIGLKFALFSMALHGVRAVMYAGEGEPLLHPDIAQIVCWTKSNGIDVAITTNGVALTPKFCHDALGSCTWIKISCNAGDAHTYAKMHGCSQKDWHKVWKNIEHAVKARDAFGLSTTIGVQSILLPDNAKSMNSLARQCRDSGVDYLVVKPYSQHMSSLTHVYEDTLYEDNYDKYLNALKMYASSTFEIITRRRSLESWDEKHRPYDTCHSVPYFWAYLMSTGDVYGCSAFLGDTRFCYGNINELSFKKIWLGEGRREAMKFMADRFNIAECRANCRMHHINQFLWDVANPSEHRNFI